MRLDYGLYSSKHVIWQYRKLILVITHSCICREPSSKYALLAFVLANRKEPDS